MTSMTGDLTRRDLIRRGASSVAAAVALSSALQACSGSDAEPEAISDSDLDSTTSTSSSTTTPIDTAALGLVDPAVLAVGDAYLKAVPEEADIAILSAALGDPAVTDALGAAQTLIQADFANQRTVNLDGWILARSEVRAAALLALVCGSSC